ncbi:MAG: hypothetical protein WBQ60_10350 [Asticcacaulis sp.]
MAKTSGLSFHQPEVNWMLIAGATSLCLHGFFWWLSRTLLGDPQAAAETLRQMMLAPAWIISTLIIWKISLPPTRLHAVLSVLGCVFLMIVLGSIAAFIKLTVLQAYPVERLLKAFSLLSLMMLLTQLFLAVPAAILLQALTLRRTPDSAG